MAVKSVTNSALFLLLFLPCWCLSLVILLVSYLSPFFFTLYTLTIYIDQASSTYSSFPYHTTNLYHHTCVSPFQCTIITNCDNHFIRNPEINRPALLKSNKHNQRHNEMALTKKKPVIFVIGGPGSGKGTICYRIKAKWVIINFSIIKKTN